MGRPPCCEKVGLKKGSWTPEEDQKLISYIQEHGHGSWRALPAKAGLRRCGKSCRLRWTNYLRPDIKRGKFSSQEEHTIIQLQALLGNRWSAIATHLPKRTDNEIKNYWNTHLKKRLSKMGIDPVTHKPKSYSLGSATGGLQSKEAANLSHMAQWESARLEAEARFVGKKGPHPITNSLQVGAPISLSVGGVKAWQGVWSADYPFNSSHKLLPIALWDRRRVGGVRVGDQKWREEGRQSDGAAADNVPEFMKDHEEMPFPDIHYSEEDNGKIVLSCDSFDVDAFSEHLFPDNSSLSFGEEDSDIGNENYVAGSGAPAAAAAAFASTSVSGFEENGHFWNNIVSLLDYSCAF